MGGGQNMIQKKLRLGERECFMRASFWRDDIVRLQFSRSEEFGETGLNRYGFILPPQAGPEASCKDEGPDFEINSGRLAVRYDGAAGELGVTDLSTGKHLLKQTRADFEAAYAEAGFEARPEEDWAGFGDQARDRMFHRGHVADLYVRNITAYIPVPFFISTSGYGVLANTTHRIIFDMAKTSGDAFFWRDSRGVIDYYIIAGANFKDILSSYTDLTGKPKLPPIWAFGLWYLFRDEANDWEVIQSAESFRREGIPCDVIGLEPGWMETNYDFSLEKKWNPRRFPKPKWKKPMGAGTFPRVLKDMGYKLELWLCNAYDLSYEAERRIGNEAGGARAAGPGKGEAEFHPDGIADERLARGVGLFDKLTRPEEPWFEHLKKFVDDGADFFKMDAANEVYRHADHIWGNGMTDAEMHNLYPLLYSRQMHEGFEEHTGRRGLSFNPCGWAGHHAWTGTWTGDIGGTLDSIGSILNLGFAAQSWNTNDMSADRPEMFHCSYLLPLSQINGYGSLSQPWLQAADVKKSHLFYSRLRSRLMPYIYSWAFNSTVTGCPVVRPLPLEFPEDGFCRGVMNQYLFGRDLMVTASGREAYFPAGRWADYWTGGMIEGGAARAISWEPPRAGGLFVREGGIIPHGPLMQYRGERPEDEIELLLFPGPVESSLDFYQDDGVTLKHMEGSRAVTPVRALKLEDKTKVVIGETSGDYEGRPENLRWSLSVLDSAEPSMVSADGKKLPGDMYEFEHEARILRVRALEGPVEVEIVY